MIKIKYYNFFFLETKYYKFKYVYSVMSLKIIRSKNIYVYIGEDNKIKIFFFFEKKKIQNFKFEKGRKTVG